MTVSQQFITPSTPMGANLVAGQGATFKVWAPEAQAVYINGGFDGEDYWKQDGVPSLLLQKDAAGYWTGFVRGAADGDKYKFFVVGKGTKGYKRDPYARELGDGYPLCDCIIRDPDSYPWHDAGYHPPAFNDLVIYQFHVGTFYGHSRSTGDGRFLDVLDRIEYLADLGINAIAPLPVVEYSAPDSMGYDGTDLFSPESDYIVPFNRIDDYLPIINRLLAQKGHASLERKVIEKDANQLKALIDICHLYGIAVIFDVVYNHASSAIADNPDHDQSIYYFDRQQHNGRENSLYFTKEDHCGPVFAFWKQEVRQFLIDNACFFVDEYHVDGFRYDQTSVIVKQNVHDGWRFCQHITSTLKHVDPSTIHIAEYWGVDPWVVKGHETGGANFDSCWHDGLRDAIWNALKAARGGASAEVAMDAIAASLHPDGFIPPWKKVHYIESHDEARVEKQDRIARMADTSDARSWYARSRAKVATGLVLTASGIPMLFMGQEILEDKQWSDNPSYFSNSLIYWEGLSHDKIMSDHHRFTRELIRLRHRLPALRADQLKVHHVHNDNRVIAFHRWVEWAGHDVVVVASLNEDTSNSYQLGFPRAGKWVEVFNSNTYENWVNSQGVGNGGAVYAAESPMHGLPASASIVIPTNSILVFALE